MECSPEEAAEGLAIVRVLAAVLDRLVSVNAQVNQSNSSQVTKFQALKSPGIGILQYLERIHKYASCSNECFILALIYIDRLIQGNHFHLSELNVHRVVITAILLAAKFFDDAYYNNAYYAKVGGVLTSEMNGLEVDFLFRINFSLHVTPELFEKYRNELLSHSVTAAMNPQPNLQTRTGQKQVQCGLSTEDEHSSHFRSGQTDVVVTYPVVSRTEPSLVSPSPDIVSMNDNGIPNAGGNMEDALTENRGNMEDVLVENPNLQHFYPSTAQFFQRRHSMPLYGETVYPSQAQPPPYYCVHSAPTTVAEMSTETFPLMKNIEGTGQYIVVDNQFFHFQGMHQSHAVDAADFLSSRGVQNAFHEHSNATNAYGTRDGNTHFSGGQMLASVSGGI